jgi:hypothetical protein
MRQILLWDAECEEKRMEVWRRLSEESRAELVTQLVRLVVQAALNAGNPAESERGDHGIKSASATPRP